MLEWFPIETAPKDGSWIIVWVVEGYWLTDANVAVAFWGDEGGWWDSESASQPVDAFERHISHWARWPDGPVA